MKKSYDEIDEMIRQALSEEEAKFYDDLGEQSVPEMVGGLFKGKNRWFTILTFVIQPIMFGLAVYCAIKFFNTEDLRTMMIWGLGIIVSLLSSTMLKVFLWMQMDKNAIIREVKRLELQVAMLNGKLEDKELSDGA